MHIIEGICHTLIDLWGRCEGDPLSRTLKHKSLIIFYHIGVDCVIRGLLYIVSIIAMFSRRNDYPYLNTRGYFFFSDYALLTQTQGKEEYYQNKTLHSSSQRIHKQNPYQKNCCNFDRLFLPARSFSNSCNEIEQLDLTFNKNIL